MAAVVGGDGDAVGSVGADEELGLKEPYGEFGWSIHWLVCSLRGTAMKTVIVYSHQHHCCRATGSGNGFGNNLMNIFH